MRRLNDTSRVSTPQVNISPSSDWLRFNMASEPRKDINMNQYSTHKSISHGIINVALFISNGKGLRGAIDGLHGDSKCKGDTDCIARSYSYAVAAIFILSLSLLLQVKLGTKFIFPLMSNTIFYDCFLLAGNSWVHSNISWTKGHQQIAGRTDEML